MMFRLHASRVTRGTGDCEGRKMPKRVSASTLFTDSDKSHDVQE